LSFKDVCGRAGVAVVRRAAQICTSPGVGEGVPSNWYSGGLDDLATRIEFTTAFRVLNHRHANAVLDAGQRVKKLAFDQNPGVVLRDHAAETHQGCPPDGRDDARDRRRGKC